MTNKEFNNMFNDNISYLDGATGSCLVKEGMPSGVCPEKWITEHPDIMIKLQESYISAGSDIIYCPTFTANRVKLAEYGLENEMEDLITRLVNISKTAVKNSGKKVYIAGDITMTGEQLAPMGKMELEELINIYKEQIVLLDKAGVDLLVVETMMSLAETRAALIAAKEVCNLPVIVTMTFEADGRTLYGTDPKTAAICLESLGACAIGANCSTGPSKMVKIISDIAAVTNVPVIAKPNAGMPKLDSSGNTVYDMDKDTFVEEMKLLVNAGATILGGCCGTSPEYIKAIHDCFGKEKTISVPRKISGHRFLCSERSYVEFELNDRFMVVGERINPTGKKALQAELREGRFDKVIEFAQEQESCGAKILDINVGMSGIDEKDMMLKAIETVTEVTNLPLCIDSSYVDVIETALRHYPGRALINSISYESGKFEKLIPIAKKYGAMFILLPLSDEGLPKNISEKINIINKIYDRAVETGLNKEDIIVDGLVATIGADKRAALEVFDTIKYCKEKGFATICGLSNISFGMPERSYINSTFLTMAIKEGLNMAIANPSQQLLMCCSFASDLLLAKKDSDIDYINYANNLKQVNKDADKQASSEKLTDTEALHQAVLKGNRNTVQRITQDLLKAGYSPQELLNNTLLPAINEVGDLFNEGKYFLPQLISGAEAMKLSIEILEPLMLTQDNDEDKPTIVIATVEGDIHDIGKNLVALMLKNYGFKVIDLGKDVSKEKILDAAIQHNASIIALSALMTTTMQRMREVVELVRAKGLNIKVMIGGAVITQDFADEIGADGYSKDAADAVKLAQRLTVEQ